MSLIYTTPSEYPVSVAQVKAYLRITTSADDTIIAGMIAAACEEAQHALQRAVGERTITLSLDAFPGEAGAIRLQMPPLIDLVSVYYTDEDGVDQELDQVGLYLDDKQEPAWIMPVTDGEWPDTLENAANAVRIQYTAGYTSANIPATLSSWIIMRVGAMYENRESHSDRAPTEVTFVDRLIDHLRVPVI